MRTIRIPLSRGKHALIDGDMPAEIVREIASAKWCAWKNRRGHWYAVRTQSRTLGWPRKQLLMHRVIMDGIGRSAGQIDHKNGDGLDNRLSNLRPCTRGQNTVNTAPKNPTGIKNVCKRVNAQSVSYQVMFQARGKFIYGGSFKSLEEGAAVAERMRTELWGEFARDNAIDARLVGAVPGKEMGR